MTNSNDITEIVKSNIPFYPLSISPSRLAEKCHISQALCTSIVTALTWECLGLCEDDNGRLSVVRVGAK